MTGGGWGGGGAMQGEGRAEVGSWGHDRERAGRSGGHGVMQGEGREEVGSCRGRAGRRWAHDRGRAGRRWGHAGGGQGRLMHRGSRLLNRWARPVRGWSAVSMATLGAPVCLLHSVGEGLPALLQLIRGQHVLPCLRLSDGGGGLLSGVGGGNGRMRFRSTRLGIL